MPDFNYVNPPGAGTLAPGATPTGDDIEQNWYFPVGAVPVSLEVINGHLTTPNLALLQRFKRYHVQRGALSTGATVGSTANADYFWTQFGGLQKLYEDNPRQWIRDRDLVQYYEPVPGANIEFYNPYDRAAVLLNWNIMWFNDGYIETGDMNNAQNNITKVQMFYTTTPNGTEQTLDGVGNRKCPPCFVNPGVFPNTYWPWTGDPVHLNAMACRSWSGHKLISVNGKGWYSAGLRILFAGQAVQQTNGTIRNSAAAIYQSRVRTRSMRYILFKR